MQECGAAKSQEALSLESEEDRRDARTGLRTGLDIGATISQENIEKLRQAYEAFSRGDFDEALTFAHPDIEFFPPGDAAPYRGIEKFRAWMEPDAFDWQVIEPLEFIVSGNKVLVKQRVKARGAGSGIELEGRSWSVWTVNEEGLATRVEGFVERDESQAREAAGLQE